MKDFLTDEEMNQAQGAAPTSHPDFISDADMSRIENSQPQVGRLEATARGALQGGTLGWSDEAIAKAESLATKKSYEQALAEARASNQAAKAAHPNYYLGGEMGGGVATALVPGLGAASVLGKIGMAGALGAAGGLGYSTATEPTQLALDTGIGAGTGLIAGAAGEGIAGILSNTSAAAMKSGAEKMAARAMGSERATTRKLGYDTVKKIGRYGLDEGIITPDANVHTMMERNEAMSHEGVKLMNQAYKSIDDAAASTYSPTAVADRVQGQLGDTMQLPINQSRSRQLQKTVDSIRNMGEDLPIDTASMQKAAELKTILGKESKWKQNVPLTDKEIVARQAYGIVNKSIDDAAQEAAEKLGNPGIASDLARGKGLYGMSQKSYELLEKKQAREQGNKMFGLTDWIAASHNPLTGIPTVAAKKTGERFGPATTAVGLNKLSQKMEGSAPEAIRSYLEGIYGARGNLPYAAGQQFTTRVVENNPATIEAYNEKLQGTKYANIFTGDSAKDAIAHKLMFNRDPEYAKLVSGEQE